jgi:hypothetical protein
MSCSACLILQASCRVLGYESCRQLIRHEFDKCSSAYCILYSTAYYIPRLCGQVHVQIEFMHATLPVWQQSAQVGTEDAKQEAELVPNQYRDPNRQRHMAR